jgi:(2R)-3-sulfolactate dehydrogenase (NADP+)
LQDLASRALIAAGASPLQTESTVKALLAADAQGLASHGASSRIPMYAAHLRHGRVDGKAVPTVSSHASATALVDAHYGFAFPACELAVREAVTRAADCGIAIAAVTNSHHFGAAAYHLEAVAEAGMVGIAIGNAPASMPFVGGKRAIFGTNPIAACFPRHGQPPVMIDLALSEVARGKIMVAAQQGKPIPLGWALDKDGNPTTDAKAALGGFMLPAGGSKGAMLALMVELLVTSLTGACFGAEVDSFFVDEGGRPRLGHAFIAINPGSLAGQDTYYRRVDALLEVILADEGIRLPGDRRRELEAKARANGIPLAPAMLEQLRRLAG